jgi:hypothetical protein
MRRPEDFHSLQRLPLPPLRSIVVVYAPLRVIGWRRENRDLMPAGSKISPQLAGIFAYAYQFRGVIDTVD